MTYIQKYTCDCSHITRDTIKPWWQDKGTIELSKQWMLWHGASLCRRMWRACGEEYPAAMHCRHADPRICHFFGSPRYQLNIGPPPIDQLMSDGPDVEGYIPQVGKKIVFLRARPRCSLQ